MPEESLRKTILIVDDEPYFSNSLIRSLQSKPYKVHSVRSVDDAIQWITKEKVDACITDLAFEGKSGKELMTWIRNSSPVPDLPIIVQSGHASLAFADLVHLNPIRVFQKPYAIGDLLDCLGDILDQEKPSR